MRGADPFLRWVLSLAPDARITAPEELRRDFQDLAASVAALYRNAGAEAVKDE